MKRTMKICLGKGGHNKRIEERIILFLLDCWIAISSRFSGSTVATDSVHFHFTYPISRLIWTLISEDLHRSRSRSRSTRPAHELVEEHRD
jgi:hypothetical protein